MLKSDKTQEPIVLGILGAGQLAKMLASAAYRLGINVTTIDNGEQTPAGDMTQYEFVNGWDDAEDLEEFIAISDIVTLENEFIDPKILRQIEKQVPVFPSSKTMELIQDKFIQKSTFSAAGIPVSVFIEINTFEEAEKFGNEHSYPFILKTRTLGYDGYGNFTVNNELDIQSALNKFEGKKLMAEKFVNFSKELAVMVVRSRSGETATYPCVETIQKDHICHTVIAPARIGESIANKARELAVECVKSIDGVGVFGVELFLDESGEILVNEIAPRPHNSGHYTIEACETSQFENCIRAILDLPLGATDMIKPAAVMVNLLGTREGVGVPTDITAFLKFNFAKLHLYNKKLCRPGRKMGHITALGDDIQETINYALQSAEALVW